VVSELSKNPDGFEGQECLPRKSISDSQSALTASNGQASLPPPLVLITRIDDNPEHIGSLVDFPVS